MSESSNRKKDQSTHEDDHVKPSGRKRSSDRRPVRVGSPSWLAPVMVGCWVLGLLWIVVFYLVGQDVPGMKSLGNWNIMVGMGLIAVGFVLSTKWE